MRNDGDPFCLSHTDALRERTEQVKRWIAIVWSTEHYFATVSNSLLASDIRLGRTLDNRLLYDVKFQMSKPAVDLLFSFASLQ